MFCIVKFTEEDDQVEVVPEIWIEDDKCYWPPYKGDSINKAVKNSETPSPDWSLYSVKVIQYYGNILSVIMILK